MDSLSDVTAYRRAIRQYLPTGQAKLPDAVFQQLEGYADNPVAPEAISMTAELLYANRGELDDDGRTLAAQCASFAAMWGFYGLAAGGRGALIIQALNRDSGGKLLPGQPTGDASADPAPLPQFAPKDATPATVPAG